MLPRLSLALALVLTVCKSQSASLSDEDLNFLVLRNIVMYLSRNIEYETLTPFGNSNCSSCQDCIANGGICMNDMGNWTEYGPLESLTTLGPPASDPSGPGSDAGHSAGFSATDVPFISTGP